MTKEIYPTKLKLIQVMVVLEACVVDYWKVNIKGYHVVYPTILKG